MTVSDIQPPAVRGSPLIDQHALSAARAASVHRHPSSNVLIPGPTCARCGFRVPAVHNVPSAILAIADQWAPVLRRGGTENALIEAARLRDEVHVVANRVSRVLADPGSAILAGVRIDTPTAWTRSTNGDQLMVLLRLAVERLAALVAPLGATDWGLTGRAGQASLSIRDLTLVPLHRSHGRLTRGQTCR